MSAVNWAEELDFTLVFEEDGRQTAGPDDVRPPPSSAPLHQAFSQEPPCPAPPHHPQAAAPPPRGSGTAPCGTPGRSTVPASRSPPSPLTARRRAAASWSRDQLYLPLDGGCRDAALSLSPCSSLSSRSWLSDRSSCESFSHVYDDVEGELNEAAARFTLGEPLPSPLRSPVCGGGAYGRRPSPRRAAGAGFGVELWQQQYQHPLAFGQALSPGQSPCPSPRTSITEESWLNPRPASRSSSRPTSPCGKRRHSGADRPARSPSPHRSPSPTPGASPRGSVTDDTWAESPAGTLGSLLGFGPLEPDVPSKTRRTAGGPPDELADLRNFLDRPGEERGERDGLADLFLPVPAHFSWNKPKPGNPPLFRPSSPPPADWPLPSRFELWELQVEVQPRSHHRAHYETEGSRGSIKAAAGGHPVVKLQGYSEQPVSLLVFIGTADDRYIRPHPFYQVHRVTGKTVSTACQERLLGNTKVLEIPLLPENNMAASIDCAGILKLRNADIELKKGETDIGRKNTRVRVVFRVGVPQPGGRLLCLQAASVPVECSQRSAQELPQVESFSPAGCCVSGGEEMTITGSNISTQSRVIFMEKGPDGRSQWEVDVKIVPEKSSGSSVVVEIPPYYNKKTTCPVQVQFYISNGKRRRSLSHSFTFLTGPRLLPPAAGAPLVKQEHWEPDYIPHNASVFCPASSQRALCPDTAYYDPYGLPVHCGPPSQNLPLLLQQQLPSPSLHSSLLDSNRQPEQHRLIFQLDSQEPELFSSPPQISSVSPRTSPIPLQTSLIFPHASTLPHQSSSIPPQTSLMAPQTSSMAPQTSSMAPQTSLMAPQTSSMAPQTSSMAPQTSLMASQTSTIPHQTSSMPPQTSLVPPQTFSMPPQTSLVPPQTFSMPPQTSMAPQISSFPPHTSTITHQTSSIPPRTSSMPPQTSCGGPGREQISSGGPGREQISGGPGREKISGGPGREQISGGPGRVQISCGGPGGEQISSLGSSRAFLTSDPQQQAGEALSIKQEEEEEPSLQEITLDDLNEIIDRDIGGVSQSDRFDQFQLDWEQKSGDASPFCGGLQ
ncbi:LOW QUALITY PROTEIN: nuclear factor of activated T-cells, cytoplasmic 3-like [Centroberyx affinis]|uniref:LOW QUALITY PROTEIN: nuclear factor of activated T-cells, cytoplasmic 3-like n=1 Tax=Centroberyx affinis TaxID=166261 RepID=UPI003A5BD25E